ncbi:hypothetical protein E9840_04660 [Tissierella creatinini]|nr:hypothetical protein E9840_04660 [Tissierella creatinini]TJX63956.1 hypothetical protein E8P77_13520 [Soehngenia saccharolytica]
MNSILEVAILLNQILKISNVGIFKDYVFNQHIHGDVEFRKLSIIYGKNGSGKSTSYSTIVEMFKSLNQNNNDIIIGRKTLSSSNTPEIEIVMDNELFRFNNNWDRPYPNIVIFDQEFINENIYLADSISTDNRRNQFKLIIGKENIEIAKQLDNINTELRENKRNLKKYESYLHNQIKGNISIKEYINLRTNESIEEINVKLKELYKMQESFNQISEMNNLKPLSQLEKPEFNLAGFISFINNNINYISANVEKYIKNYCHSKDINIDWIDTGFSKVKDNRCPFCNQRLEHSDIFSIYKDYFNENMVKYNNTLNCYLDSINENFRNERLLEINLVMEENNNLFYELNRYLQMKDGLPKTEDIISKASSVFSNINTIFTNKVRNQFEDLALKEQLYLLRDEYNAYIKELETYNLEVYGINQMLEVHKKKLEEFDSHNNEEQINYYLNLITLTNPIVAAEIASYQALLNRIEELEHKKINLKNQSMKIDKKRLSEFYQVLNEVLRNLELTFKVSNAFLKYNTYGIEVDFSLIIDNTKIKSRTPKNNQINKPNFKNTLSEGEKSLLALAYFITSLKLNISPRNSIIVFDDPTNYCDNKNKAVIAKQVSQLLTKDNQILVFTHDFDFTKRMVEINDKENMVGLYIDYFDLSAQLITSEKAKNRG